MATIHHDVFYLYNLCLCVVDGQFGAYMQVHIQNDGPVTIQLESPTGPTDPRLVSSFDSLRNRSTINENVSIYNKVICLIQPLNDLQLK